MLKSINRNIIGINKGVQEGGQATEMLYVLSLSFVSGGKVFNKEDLILTV